MRLPEIKRHKVSQTVNIKITLIINSIKEEKPFTFQLNKLLKPGRIAPEISKTTKMGKV